jgi:hypothetical protein
MRTLAFPPVLAILAALCAPGQALAVPVTISAGPPGSIRLAPGADLLAGYTLRLPTGHAANELRIEAASVAIAGRCADGSATTVTIPLAGGRYVLPAGVAARAFQGTARLPRSLCHGAGLLTAGGATFVADVRAARPARADVSFRLSAGRSIGWTSDPVGVAAGDRRAAPLVRAVAVPPSAVPGLRIAATQKVAGNRVDYRFTVSNTSATPLSVAFSNPRCDTGSLSPSAVQSILPGTSLSWECWHTAVPRDGGSVATTAAALAMAGDGTQLGPVAATLVARVAARR